MGCCPSFAHTIHKLLYRCQVPVRGDPLSLLPPLTFTSSRMRRTNVAAAGRTIRNGTSLCRSPDLGETLSLILLQMMLLPRAGPRLVTIAATICITSNLCCFATELEGLPIYYYYPQHSLFLINNSFIHGRSII